MRRTKEEAAQTRASIVAAALQCFDRHGIAGSTLDQIAAEAGVTKGAVYHHFGSKREIFHELRERVNLPLLDEADTEMLRANGAPALDRVEHFLAALLNAIANDPHTQSAIGVMQFKCEYVDELAAELHDSLRNNMRLAGALRTVYREARRRGELARGLSPDVAAIETLMFISGLVRLWLMHPAGHSLRKGARAAIRSHIALRRTR